MRYQTRRHLYLRLALLAFALAAAPLVAAVLYDARGQGGMEIAAGWVLMAVSVGLLILVLRDRAVASLGLLAVAVLSVYHGVSGALYALFPEGARYREAARVADWATAHATFYAGLGICLFTVAYLLVIRRRAILTPAPNRTAEVGAEFERINCGTLLAWTLVAIAYQSGVATLIEGSAAAYWIGAFTISVYLPLVVLTALRVIVAVRAGEVRRGTAVLYGLCLAFAMVLLVAHRLDVVVATVATTVLAAKWRLGKPSRLAVVAGGSVLLVLFVALAALRSAVGRDSLAHASFRERVPLVIEGLFSERARTTGLQVAAKDAGYRADGNAFLAGMIQARSHVAQSVDLTPFRIIAGLMIPSAIWSAKLDQDVTERSAKSYFVATRHLGETDYLVTPLALFYAAGGLPFMLFLMAASGVALGWLDRLVTHRANVVTIVAAACAAVAIGQSEQDVTAWGLYLRAAVILSVALSLMAVRFRRHRTHFVA